MGESAAPFGDNETGQSAHKKIFELALASTTDFFKHNSPRLVISKFELVTWCGDNKEAGIGAVSENGLYFVNSEVKKALGVSDSYIQKEVQNIIEKIKAKRAIYKKPKVSVKNRDVIIVDDGIATGSSMILATKALKEEGANKVLVAAPVAPIDAILQLEQIADEVVVLKTPSNFMAVGAYYKDFHQLSDEEVVELLNPLS